MTDRNNDSEPAGGRPLSRRRLLAATGALGGGLLAGCLGSGESGSGATTTDAMAGAGTDAMGGSTNGTDAMDGSSGDSMNGTDAGDSMAGETTTAAASGWQSMELTNVLTGETFTIAGFDTPVVLETFAVWCPKCTRQQRTLASLKSQMGSDVAVVSLNVDPNEDAAKVKSHATENGFDWHYAVSPPELTKALVDQFGTVVTSPPSVPVITVCADGSASLMESRGQKSVSDIRSKLGEC